MARKINPGTLRDRRRQAGVSQWAVAKELGRSQGWISVRECGYQTPTDSEAIAIANAIESLKRRGYGDQN